MKLTTLLLSLMCVCMISAQSINWEKLDMDNAFGFTSTVDSQNNVIVVASGPSFLSPKTMYVRKYDVNGNLLMQTSVDALNLAGGNSDNLLPYQVETDSQDNIENDKTIDLSSLKSGFYFAKFDTQAGNSQTKKIIKQ